MRTQVEINTQTYNVVSENNKLLIRNAIDDIPKVSFLLSHIDIKVGDILDIGDQGLYSVKVETPLPKQTDAPTPKMFMKKYYLHIKK